MIELLLVCALTSSQAFEVPKGWSVERIGPQGVVVTSGVGSIRTDRHGPNTMILPGPGYWELPESSPALFVYLRRAVALQEQVDVPNGCKASVALK